MIKQFTPSKICLNCSGCCRFSRQESVWLPHLLKQELKRIKKIKAIPNPREDNFICAFLNPADNKCRIYKMRPFECGLYPLLLDRKAGKVFLAVDLNCPYIQSALKGGKFKEYVNYLIKLLNSRRYLNIIKNNPQIIQSYSGVLDIIELKRK